MKLTWQEKQSRLAWARRNAAKVREANRLYRLGNWDKVTRQARERMRRFRSRMAKSRRNGGTAIETISGR